MLSQTTQVVYEGVRGPGFRGDIALDDIKRPACGKYACILKTANHTSLFGNEYKIGK